MPVTFSSSLETKLTHCDYDQHHDSHFYHQEYWISASYVYHVLLTVLVIVPDALLFPLGKQSRHLAFLSVIQRMVWVTSGGDRISYHQLLPASCQHTHCYYNGGYAQKECNEPFIHMTTIQINLNCAHRICNQS